MSLLLKLEINQLAIKNKTKLIKSKILIGLLLKNQIKRKLINVHKRNLMKNLKDSNRLLMNKQDQRNLENKKNKKKNKDYQINNLKKKEELKNSKSVSNSINKITNLKVMKRLILMMKNHSLLQEGLFIQAHLRIVFIINKQMPKVRQIHNINQKHFIIMVKLQMMTLGMHNLKVNQNKLNKI